MLVVLCDAPKRSVHGEGLQNEGHRTAGGARPAKSPREPSCEPARARSPDAHGGSRRYAVRAAAAPRGPEGESPRTVFQTSTGAQVPRAPEARPRPPFLT